MPEQADMVRIPIPFTDLTSHKRRPVIVVSNGAYDRKGADTVETFGKFGAAALERIRRLLAELLEGR